jgi:hypothetical protein
MYEINVSPKKVIKGTLITELEALAIEGVRTFSVIGAGDDCHGVYAWRDDAPVGEYHHIALSDAEKQRVADVVAAHTFVPPVDPDEELALAIESATTLAQLRDALLGKLRRGKVAGKPV